MIIEVSVRRSALHDESPRCVDPRIKPLHDRLYLHTSVWSLPKYAEKRRTLRSILAGGFQFAYEIPTPSFDLHSTEVV